MDISYEERLNTNKTPFEWSLNWTHFGWWYCS